MSTIQDIVNTVDKADAVNLVSISRLVAQCDESRLAKIITYVNEKIADCSNEGNFTCIISNDELEELFLDDSGNAFDEYLLTATVAIYRRKGYIIKYEDLMYTDINNVLEINW